MEGFMEYSVHEGGSVALSREGAAGGKRAINRGVNGGSYSKG